MGGHDGADEEGDRDGLDGDRDRNGVDESRDRGGGQSADGSDSYGYGEDHGRDENYSHDENHSHDRRSAGRRALVLALGINTAFFLVEIAGALLADSLTLLADAAHMLTDSASLGLALLAAWLADRPPDEKRTYGYHRAEVLGALANGLFLLAVVGYILYDAYRRFQSPKVVDAQLVIVIGVVGLAANLAAASVLQEHRDNLNIEGAFLHLLADAAGSVAAVTLGVALLFTDLYVLDPLFALLIAALVLYSTKDLLRDSLNILLQGTPGNVEVDAVTAALEELEGVDDVHDVHVWALDSSRWALSAHVVADESADANGVIAGAQRLLGEEFDIDHATIQVESGTCVDVANIDCYPSDEG